jgi:hypothetical protein
LPSTLSLREPKPWPSSLLHPPKCLLLHDILSVNRAKVQKTNGVYKHHHLQELFFTKSLKNIKLSSIVIRDSCLKDPTHYFSFNDIYVDYCRKTENFKCRSLNLLLRHSWIETTFGYARFKINVYITKQPI